MAGYMMMKDAEEKEINDIFSNIHITTPSYTRIKNIFIQKQKHKITYNKIDFYFKVIRTDELKEDLNEFRRRSHNYLESGNYILQRVTIEESLMYSSSYAKWKKNSKLVDLLKKELNRLSQV